MPDPDRPARARLAAAADAAGRRPGRLAPSHPAVVGRVFARVTVPAAGGVYFAVHPAAVSGSEAEAAVPAVTPDAARSVLAYVLPGGRVPVAGDDLVCRLVGSRWAADRLKVTGSGIGLPGCPCADLPATITMSVTNPGANFGMFQDASLAYQSIPAGYAGLGLAGAGGKGFLSTAGYHDDFSADVYHYFFFCSGGFYCLTRVYLTSAFGSPYREAVRYRWLVGNPGNTCTPFLLSNGVIFQGGNAATRVTLSP